MKKVKLLKFLITVIVIILIIQLFYVLYFFLFARDNKFYFDGVNSISYYEDTYYTVGSNNDNTKYYEKGKVTSYDIDFNKVKEKLYNNEFGSVYYDLSVDEESIVTVGSFEEDKKAHKNKNSRALLVKYDKEGNVLFEKTFGKLDKTSFTGIINDKDYYATGFSNSDKDKAGGAYLLKINKINGNIKWKKHFGNKKYGKYNDLVKIDNYIYTVGLYDKNIGIVSKYDLNGKLIKHVKYKYTDDIGFSSISFDDEYLYVVGSKKDSIDSKYKNAVLVKYNYDLEKKNEITYGMNKSRYNKLLIDGDKVIVIGIYKKKDYNGIISMYSKDLEEVDVVFYGNEDDDFFTDIIKVDGNYIVCGYSSYKRNYLTKFITYSNALKVLGVK
ncbi:MAG: hypothetical protein IJL76_02940 [Bacilli bacterium]|nr:hypothetical protein [Bacilli bacterium]